jgi:hypothetical protein
MLRLTVLLCSCCAVLALTSAPALAEQQTAASGDVSATFTYDEVGDFEFPEPALGHHPRRPGRL